MMGDRFIWRLAVRSLTPDPYGKAILGDLIEERMEIARVDGAVAADRWFRRELLRSWLAFFPSLRFSARDACIAAFLALTAYLAAVNSAAPLAFTVSDKLQIIPDYHIDLIYLGAVAVIGGTTAYVLTCAGELAILRAAIFLGAGVVFGLQDMIASARAEFGFRVAKLIVFLAVALVTALLGLNRQPKSTGGGNLAT
jgi:hypothetical protein